VAGVQGRASVAVSGRKRATKVTKTIFACAFAGKPNRFRAKEYGIWRLFALDQSIKR
jgi:hypothetical protein